MLRAENRDGIVTVVNLQVTGVGCCGSAVVDPDDAAGAVDRAAVTLLVRKIKAGKIPAVRDEAVPGPVATDQ